MLETESKALGNKNKALETTIGGSAGNNDRSVKPTITPNANPTGIYLAGLCWINVCGQSAICTTEYPIAVIADAENKIIKTIVSIGKRIIHIGDCAPIILAKAPNPDRSPRKA